MQFGIKFKGITYRWFFQIFLLIALAVCVAAVAFSSLFTAWHIGRMEDLAADYTYEFASLANSNQNNFKDNAISIVGEFKYKDKIEVQVIDRNSNVIASTTGFLNAEEEMPDYIKARETKTTQKFRGKSSEGQSIMAASTMIYSEKGEELGAYRWITSMKEANKLIGFVIAAVVLVCVSILAFSAITGIYFVASIVKPIRNVSNIARNIAMGDFNSRIEIKKDDEIGELCDSINYMAAELSNSQNIKNDFISSVSHELRTPLTAIRGWGETAKMSIGFDEELVTRGLDVVLSEADRLSGLVEELLDFSRMETGRLSLISQPLNVSLILRESADMYTELAKKQEIELVLTAPREDITVLGDSNRLKQVFINVIDNAVKYTESGGQVLVDLIIEEACVRITVKDTGVGIPAQDIDRVKEKFYKANKTVRGSGIGLAVADEIIKQHDGLLFIESIENVGTTVTIVIPIYEELIQEKPEEIIEAGEDNG